MQELQLKNDYEKGEKMTQRIKVLTYRVNGKSFEIKEVKFRGIFDIQLDNGLEKTIKALETLKISYQITYINEVVKK